MGAVHSVPTSYLRYPYTSLLPVYSPQDIRTRQLEDNLIGSFLRAKEIGDQPPSTQKGPKWCKMVQLWNQLFVKNGAFY